MTERQFVGNWEVQIAGNGDLKSFYNLLRSSVLFEQLGERVKGVVMSK